MKPPPFRIPIALVVFVCAAFGPSRTAVAAANDPPTANPQAVSTNEDVARQITLTGSDPGGNTLTFAIASQPANGSVTLSGATATYTPNANFNGADSFTFTVRGGGTTSAAATVSVTVNAVNDAPGFAKKIYLWTGDYNSGTIYKHDASGALILTIKTNFFGHPTGIAFDGKDLLIGDSFELYNRIYKYSRQGVELSFIDLNTVGLPKVTIFEQKALAWDGEFLWYSSSARFEIYKIKINAWAAAPGSIEIVKTFAVPGSSPAGLEWDGRNLWLVDNLNRFYQLDANGNVLSSFTYSRGASDLAWDGQYLWAHGNGTFKLDGAGRTLSTLNIYYWAFSGVAWEDGSQAVNEDAGAQTVAGWATGISAGPANESSQTITFVVSNDNNGLFSVQPAVDATGALTYTPAPNAHGRAIVTVQARDNGGTANGGVDISAAETFRITVSAVNDPPVALPQSVSTNKGAAKPITLTASDPDGDNLTFAIVSQPLHGGVSVSGATATYTPFSAYTGPDSFTFTVNDGTVTSAAATVSIAVTLNDAPTITTQPANQSVAAGGTASFSVMASGVAPLSYQWRKDGTNISGATSAALSLSNVQATNAGSYSVVVSNSLGSVTSDSATLTFIVIPTIGTQPQGQSVIPGSSATFSVVASGTAPLSYQWRKDGTPIGGATSATLTLSAVQTTNAGNYTVVISNTAGSVTSSAVALTVNAGVPPTITAQPGDQAVAAGATATFTVGVSGTSPFVYQWRLNGAPIPGATNNPLILPNVTAANAGSYTVLVTNATGAANSATSSAAALTVIQPPSITTPPADQSVAAGSNVVFSVVAGGASPLSYQWSKDGRAIAGQNNAVLSLTNVTNNDAGSYSVAVSNGVATTTSRTVTLVVSPPESKIINMSVRSGAGAGSETLIMGFVISGQGASKPVLVRGIGPSLTQFGVAGVLADPELNLYRDAVSLLSNNDWGAGTAAVADQLASLFATTGAFPLNRSSKDAALRTVLQAGAYTAQISSLAGTGIALVELYDADFPAAARLGNVSARSRVGTGEGVLIMGFAIKGNAPMKVLVRGIGPALALFGVSDALADPQLVLLKGDSEVVDSNDDWWRSGGAQALAPVFNAAGAFPLVSGTADAALLALLQPGSYSAKVSGAGDTTGVALVEVYEVP